MTITTLPKEEVGDRAHPRWLDRLASAGRAYACMEVRIVDEEDRDMPPGASGEIICRGDPVMPGYWENPAANAKTMRGGWLHTGDVGAIDAEGYLTLRTAPRTSSSPAAPTSIRARSRRFCSRTRKCARCP